MNDWAIAPLSAPTTASLRPEGVQVYDGILSDVAAYRAAALASTFQTYHFGPLAFHGIALPPSSEALAWIGRERPDLPPVTLTFLRQSPEGQQEPNYVHTDGDMGSWTGILYLTEHPAEGDGTTFWRDRETGAIEASALDAPIWPDPDRWEPIYTVEAVPNRLLIFPAALYHSRALRANYGTTPETARLIQVIFGGAPLWR